MSDSPSELPLSPIPALSVASSPAPRKLFVGPLGLRAGWGVLLFIVIVSGLLYLGSAGFAEATGKGPETARGRYMCLSQEFIPEVLKPVAVLLAAFGISFLDRRRFKVYGLGLRHLRDFLPGALAGIVVMSVLVGVLRSFHLLVFDGRLLYGMAAFRSGCAWLSFYLFVGLYEEFLFRGYVLFTLMRGVLRLAERISVSHTRLVAFWISAAAWSFLFFALHLTNADETPVGLVGIFLFGILCSYALWRTGSLWWAIGFHMTWDWTESFLSGVADSGTYSIGRLFATHATGNPLLSGGLDGPEGSLLMIPVLLLAFLAIRLHPQAEQPPVEPEPGAMSLRNWSKNRLGKNSLQTE